MSTKIMQLRVYLKFRLLNEISDKCKRLKLQIFLN